MLVKATAGLKMNIHPAVLCATASIVENAAETIPSVPSSLGSGPPDNKNWRLLLGVCLTLRCEARMISH